MLWVSGGYNYAGPDALLLGATFDVLPANVTSGKALQELSL